MDLLLISNSTMPQQEYLGWCKSYISDFLKSLHVKKVLFIPYAGVSIEWDAYTAKVAKAFAEFGVEVESIHNKANPLAALSLAQAVVVGGGNTYNLVRQMQITGLMDELPDYIYEGLPFIGWSAGSNVCCPTLCTTNDMPIIEPLSFECMGIVPFQINPHYTEFFDPKHGGETRMDRLNEYMVINPDMNVVGLREASMLKIKDDTMTLLGDNPLKVFKYKQEPKEYKVGEDLSFLLEE